MSADSRALLTYLKETLTSETTYLETVNLCPKIFCTPDGLPPELKIKQLTKGNVAEAFAVWTKTCEHAPFSDYECLTDAQGLEPTEPAHWIRVQLSVVRTGS